MSSLNKSLFTQLKKDYSRLSSERRQIISASNDVLNESKKAIFAAHRQDLAGAGQALTNLAKKIAGLQKHFGYYRLIEEGAYTAAIEEFVEAYLLHQVLIGGKISRLSGLKIGTDSYLGGLCDLTGELVRHATNQAATGNWQQVATNQQLINDIMAELVAMDLTGYLRTKYDQARSNLRKIEQMAYEVNLKLA